MALRESETMIPLKTRAQKIVAMREAYYERTGELIRASVCIAMLKALGDW